MKEQDKLPKRETKYDVYIYLGLVLLAIIGPLIYLGLIT